MASLSGITLRARNRLQGGRRLALPDLQAKQARTRADRAMASPIGPDAEGEEPAFYGAEVDWGPIAVIRRKCPRGTLTASQSQALQADYACNASIRRRKPNEDRELTVRGRAGALFRPGRVLLGSSVVLSQVVFWPCLVSPQTVYGSPHVVSWLRPRSCPGFALAPFVDVVALLSQGGQAAECLALRRRANRGERVPHPT